MLYRGGEAVERLVAMLRISSESHAGVRPRDWSADALATLEHDPGGEDDAALASVRYAYAIDTQNLDAARSILDRQLSVANKNNHGFRANSCLEAALFAAHHDNNAIIARAGQKKGKCAVFVDAGAASDQPGDAVLHTGVGAGLRWASPVGPLQLDAAYGIRSHKWRLHLRVGFLF